MTRAERRLNWLREDLARAAAHAQTVGYVDAPLALDKALRAIRDAVAAIDEALLEVAKKGAA